MKRLTVLIEGTSKELELDELFLTVKLLTYENPYLMVKKATVF